jgi:hypothetical protein
MFSRIVELKRKVSWETMLIDWRRPASEKERMSRPSMVIRP